MTGKKNITKVAQQKAKDAKDSSKRNISPNGESLES